MASSEAFVAILVIKFIILILYLVYRATKNRPEIDERRLPERGLIVVPQNHTKRAHTSLELLVERNATPFAGLVNLGQTSYANSVLQILFHLKPFRELVYATSTSTFAFRKPKPVTASLKGLFFKLQRTNDIVSPEKLLQECFKNGEPYNRAQDAVEFNLRLLDEIWNEQVKKDEAPLIELFKTVVERTNRRTDSYESSTMDPNLQVHLKTGKGISNVYDGLLDFFTPFEEPATEYSLGSKTTSKLSVLPPVLQIVLRRSIPFSEGSKKTFYRTEFHETMDLNYFMQHNGATGEFVYTLFAVLVHDGAESWGHNFVYITPMLDGKWYKFSDEDVTECRKEEVFEGTFGLWDPDMDMAVGQLDPPSSNTKVACMLCYVRNDLVMDWNAEEDAIISKV